MGETAWEFQSSEFRIQNSNAPRPYGVCVADNKLRTLILYISYVPRSLVHPRSLLQKLVQKTKSVFVYASGLSVLFKEKKSGGGCEIRSLTPNSYPMLLSPILW